MRQKNQMFQFDLQLFGGGGGGNSTTVQKVEIAPQTEEERRLQAELKKYQDAGLAGAKELQERALNYLNTRTVDPDYQALLNEYNAANDEVTDNYNASSQQYAEALRKGLLKAEKNYGATVNEALQDQRARNDEAIKDYQKTVEAAGRSYDYNADYQAHKYNEANFDNAWDYNNVLERAGREYVNNTDGLIDRYNEANAAATSEYQEALKNNIAQNTATNKEALDDYIRESRDHNFIHDAASAENVRNFDETMAKERAKYEQSLADAAKNYSAIEDPAYRKYVSGMDEVDAAYRDVINGKMPTAYQQARVQALNDEMSQTMGSYLANMARRGIVNSTVSSSGIDSISQSVSDTLAKNYASDIAQQAGLIGSRGSLLQNVYNTLHGKATGERDHATTNANNLYQTASELADKTFKQHKDLADTTFANDSALTQNIFNARTGTENDRFKNQDSANQRIYDSATGLADKTYNGSINRYKDIYNTETGTAKAIFDNNDNVAKTRYATNMDNIKAAYDHATTNAGNIYTNKYNSDAAYTNGLMTAAQNIYSGQQSNLKSVYDARNQAATNIYNAGINQAQSKLSGALQAQAGSYYAPTHLLGYAQQLYLPSQNQFNTLYQGRHGAATTTTTTNSSGGGDNSGLFGAIGSVGSALIACFTAGTQITTPDGYKNIEDIKVGDEVLSLNRDGEIIAVKVKEVNEPHKAATIVVQWDNSTRWRTTINQRYYDGTHFSNFKKDGNGAFVFNGWPTKVININEGPEALVYDFTVDNEINVFFANDVAAEGFGD